MQKCKNLQINKAEALRYMGCSNQNIDENTSRLTDECIDEIMQLARPGWVYKVFDLEKYENEISLAGTKLVLRGRDISQNLLHASKCALLAATLGAEVDSRIIYYSKINLTKGLIFDACAAAACEALCDLVQEELDDIAGEMGLRANLRFSPGYGDLPLDIQKDIISILNAYNRIGLAATESCLLTPRKSVTAFVGFVEEPRLDKCRGCENCENHDKCLYRKDGCISEH